MRKRYWTLALMAIVAFALAGCHDTTSPRLAAPAAPRGLYSITGNQADTLIWLANTEPNIQGYRVYMSSTENGDYQRVGSTSNTWFIVTGLTNGVTRFFAVAAVGPDGQESALSYETVYDTPRPEGIGAAMVNKVGGSGGTGWDFAAMLARPWTSPLVDIYYRDSLSLAQVVVSDTATTKIQDMGYTSSIEVIGFAPSTGWAPSGKVEAIDGHCYVVRTRSDNYAKFRVTSVNSGTVVFDWAYQTDPGNGELNAHPAGQALVSVRPGTVTPR